MFQSSAQPEGSQKLFFGRVRAVSNRTLSIHRLRAALLKIRQARKTGKTVEVELRPRCSKITPHPTTPVCGSAEHAGTHREFLRSSPGAHERCPCVLKIAISGGKGDRGEAIPVFKYPPSVNSDATKQSPQEATFFSLQLRTPSEAALHIISSSHDSDHAHNKRDATMQDEQRSAFFSRPRRKKSPQNCARSNTGATIPAGAYGTTNRSVHF